ncbi:methyltransferase [Nonomuraea sp. NPDC049158]|uniref:methyltransferase n=1 Tax=Nonomuraea sp. NPDC049158 TaxID=3155649 RepID=UPI0033DB8D57
MTSAYPKAQYVRAMAKLGLADLLAPGAMSPAELAKELSADLEALTRFLRACGVLGLVAEHTPGSFTLTGLGELLRSDHRLHAVARANASPQMYRPYEDITHTVLTGRPATEGVLGMGFWQFLTENQEEERYFGELMSFVSAECGAAVAEHYDLSAYSKIVDVGGGHGALLTELLRASPHASGVVYDLPGVVSQATKKLAVTDVADRISVVPGDFLQEVPHGGDLYVLKSVLCDWGDGPAARILANIAEACDGAPLLLIDWALPDDPRLVDRDDPQRGMLPLMNFSVMLQIGGKVRTHTEYRTLLAGAGFESVNTVSTTGSRMGWDLFEARRS